MPRPTPRNPPAVDDERVPVFGTWRAIHLAVALCAAAVMALLALFSGWPF